MAVESEARQLIPAIEVQAEFAEMARTFVQFWTLGDQLERDIGLTPEQVDAMNASIAKQRAELYADTVSEIDDGRLVPELAYGSAREIRRDVMEINQTAAANDSSRIRFSALAHSQPFRRVWNLEPGYCAVHG